MVTCHCFICTRKTRSTKRLAIVVDNRVAVLYKNFHAYSNFIEQFGYVCKNGYVS